MKKILGGLVIFLFALPLLASDLSDAQKQEYVKAKALFNSPDAKPLVDAELAKLKQLKGRCYAYNFGSSPFLSHRYSVYSSNLAFRFDMGDPVMGDCYFASLTLEDTRPYTSGQIQQIGGNWLEP
jgi:hypothetical protein